MNIVGCVAPVRFPEVEAFIRKNNESYGLIIVAPSRDEYVNNQYYETRFRQWMNQILCHYPPKCIQKRIEEIGINSFSSLKAEKELIDRKESKLSKSNRTQVVFVFEKITKE